MERLDKYLASQGIGTRKEVAAMIRSGTVTVNGNVIKDSAAKLDPDNDIVTLNGEQVNYRKYTYIMMNKPAGVLSATEDSRQETVLDLLPPELCRRGLFPAGRLDKDTTGLLILTDDGDFAHKMLAPKSHVYKLYEAVTQREITDEDIAAFAEGMTEGGQTFAPARLTKGEKNGKEVALVEIREGKFHQVKRMFKATGNEVIELRRLKIGGLCLDETLHDGEARLMTEKEIELIFHGKMH